MKTRNILLIVVTVLIVIQFVRPSYPERNDSKSMDFLENTAPSDEVAALIRNTCYDCHSYQYNVPWYGNVAPTSWLVSNHVNEGLEELNMSEWTAYDRKSMLHKLEECAEEVGEGEMPLKSYRITHPKARFSKEERQLLVNWFNKLRK